ncbi:MAG: hypothetical protein OXF29_03810 [Hyphomicrobiales bacterium]|nr:hypothetical protein [Hyphomicrobiales bacterium]
MDNIFDENDFTVNQNLHAREAESSETTSKDIANSIREKPLGDGNGEVLTKRTYAVSQENSKRLSASLYIGKRCAFNNNAD